MKKLLLLLLAATLTFSAYAAPAYPGLITVNQADGTSLSLYLRGDEHFSYRMTEDGYLITTNADGIYEYARIENGNAIVPTGMKAHNVLTRSVNEQNFVNGLVKAESLTSELNSMRSQKTQNRMPAAEGGPRRFPLQGSPKGLIILVSFSDLAFQTSQSYFQNMANETDFSENYGTGSIRDYFICASDSQFTPTFDVYGPYTLSRGHAYYTANHQDFVVDACNAASEAGVNFAQYDNDNDGGVDNIFIYFAGHNAAEGADADEYIWPHRSRVYTSVSYDGKSISDYACTSEYSGAPSSGNTKCGIGTFCHEFSHVLGLPDFYDTDYSQGLAAMGQWDIMTSGNYNNGGHTPPTYTAYERFYIGWLTPTALTNDSTVNCEGSYVLKSLISSNTAYLVSATQHNLSGKGPNPKEFFMMEYRKMEGRDTYTGLSEGLFVTHINYNASTWGNNNPNNDKTCLGYYPVLPGKDGENHTAPTGSSAVFPYGDYDYCKFVLHGEEDAMTRFVKNITIDGDSCVTFDYITPNEKLLLKVHDIDAFRQDTVTQFVVKGSGIGEDLTVSITNNQEFTMRVHTEDNSGEFHNPLTISPDSTGVIVDTVIDVKYKPKKVTYDEYSETKFNVKGTVTATLTQVEKFRYRNRRPVYVTVPVAYDAKDIEANSALLSWSFVADTTAGIPDVEKYGAKYYVDVYNVSDQPQTETEGFENFPDSYTADWKINFETYTDQYRKSGQRAAKMTSAADTIYTKTYMSDITSVSFWLQSISCTGTFRAEVQNAATGAWETLTNITIDKQYKKDWSSSLPEGYNSLRLFYMPTEGELAVDEVSVTTGKSITYAAKNQYVKDTTYTVTGLELGKTYKYAVRATDKDEKKNTPRYENITEVSNEVEFTTRNGGGGGGQTSDSTKLVAVYDASTGGYWVSIPEVKTYVEKGKTKNYVLSVYDLAGMMVYRTEVTETTVFIPCIASSGLYFVKYSEADKSKKTDPMTKIVFRGVGMKK